MRGAGEGHGSDLHGICPHHGTRWGNAAQRLSPPLAGRRGGDVLASRNCLGSLYCQINVCFCRAPAQPRAASWSN